MSIGAIWQAVEDEADLREVRRILDHLDETLDRERTAVATLDPMALTRIGQEKQRATEDLQAILDRALDSDPAVAVVRRDDDVMRALRIEVERRLIEVRAAATVNATLLAETASAVAEALGLRTENNTYDARARVRNELTRFTAKAA